MINWQLITLHPIARLKKMYKFAFLDSKELLQKEDALNCQLVEIVKVQTKFFFRLSSYLRRKVEMNMLYGLSRLFKEVKPLH